MNIEATLSSNIIVRIENARLIDSDGVGLISATIKTCKGSASLDERFDELGVFSPYDSGSMAFHKSQGEFYDEIIDVLELIGDLPNGYIEVQSKLLEIREELTILIWNKLFGN